MKSKIDLLYKTILNLWYKFNDWLYIYNRSLMKDLKSDNGFEIKNGWYKDGSIIQNHYKNNKLHNDKGPAQIVFQYTIGCSYGILMEKYYKNNTLHRLDGPAFIKYNCNKTINKQEWFIGGKQYSKEDFNKEVLIIKMAGVIV